jgi:predicted RNA binding protein YcfA (HicA-like mRNA interferase family)
LHGAAYRSEVWCGVPRKVRQLIQDLRGAGFRQIPGGKGSHRKFAHPLFAGAVTLSGADGADAKPYQEKQIKLAIEIVES